MIGKALLVALACCIGLSGSASAQAVVSGTDLYSIDLDTGAMTKVAEIGSGEAVIGLALLSSTREAGAALALTNENELFEFNVNSPGALGNRLQVTGLEPGEFLKGIDYRPINGELWGITDQSRIYVIDLSSGEAVSIGGTLDPLVEDPNLGFDFNPAVDRIRVDVSTGQNLRLNPETGKVGSNPDTGAPTIDGDLVYVDGDANEGVISRVVGAAYTNSVPNSQKTLLYVIDAATQSLALQNPPNDGALNTVGELGVEIVDWAAFDVHPDGQAFVTNPNLVSMPATGSGTMATESTLWSVGGFLAAASLFGGVLSVTRNRTRQI